LSLSWRLEKSDKNDIHPELRRTRIYSAEVLRFYILPEAQESSVKTIDLAVKYNVKLYLADHSESVVLLPTEQGYNLMDKLADLTDVSRNAKLAPVLPTAGGRPVRIWKASAPSLRTRGGWRQRSIPGRRQPTVC